MQSCNCCEGSHWTVTAKEQGKDEEYVWSEEVVEKQDRHTTNGKKGEDTAEEKWIIKGLFN